MESIFQFYLFIYFVFLADLTSGLKPGSKSKRRRKGHMSGPSDHESVMTEDYENHFHNMMVKQVAHVPITSFDQLIVDSDLDTVKSLLVHTKFQNALSKCCNYSLE